MTDHALAIASLPYAEGAYADIPLEAIVRHFRDRGLRIAGVIQHDLSRENRSRCDMALEDLTSGTIIGLSEDRGNAARGCRIDKSGMAEAAARVAAALEGGDIDLLVINKFGKIESEGGGLRDVIAHAVTRAIPVIVGVPLRNLDAWNSFSGGLDTPFSPESAPLIAWIEGRMRADLHDRGQIQRIEKVATTATSSSNGRPSGQ
jgi:nucleoside-triphosphatase THEP1